MLTKYYDRNDLLALSFFDPFYLLSELTWLRSNKQTRPRPNYDTAVDDSGMTLTIDLPGVKKEDVKIETFNKSMTIKTKRAAEESSMSYRISKEYDLHTAAASLENGVLTLKFSKSKSNDARTIEVK